MRFVLCAAGLIAVFGLAERQAAGTVLTVSEIQYPHRMGQPVALEGRQWLSLRVLENGSRVEQVAVRWISSLEFGDSVFTLSAGTPAPTLIFSDVPLVAVGPANTLVQHEQYLSLGNPMSFALGSRNYSLELGGTAPAMCDATVTISDGTLSQDLYFPDHETVSCDEPYFSLQWVGDLDGDGRLDLVTTFSPKYSYIPRRLFLSSAAAEGGLVGLVATFDGAAA